VQPELDHQALAHCNESAFALASWASQVDVDPHLTSNWPIE
jgi:hypothetical protein